MMPGALPPLAVWLFGAVACCLATELVLRLPIVPPALAIMKLGARASRVIASRRISEHWKERSSQAYALRMGRSTLALTLWVALFAGAVAALVLGAEQVQPGVLPLLESLPGLAFAFGVSFLYYRVRTSLAR